MSFPRWNWKLFKSLALGLMLAAGHISATRADDFLASQNQETDKTFNLAAYREWRGEKVGYVSNQPTTADRDGPNRPDIVPNTMKGEPIIVEGNSSSCDCNSCSLPCYDDGCGHEGFFDNVAIFSALDAFKSPIDIGGLNGNFGSRTGIMGAFPVLPRFGLGLQGGTSAAWYDPNGTDYTGSASRFQNFTNIGVFQRSVDGRFSWGFGYDWLFDHYYSNMQLGQFRMKAGMMVGIRNEIGVWAAVPQRRDQVVLAGPAINTFRPMNQGSLYWQHWWRGTATTQTWIGVAERPGIFVVGSTAFVPLGACTALTGSFNFITPDLVVGQPRRQNEVWNVSIGLAFYPTARADRAVTNRFRPFLSMPDNGTFAVRRY